MYQIVHCCSRTAVITSGMQSHHCLLRPAGVQLWCDTVADHGAETALRGARALPGVHCTTAQRCEHQAVLHQNKTRMHSGQFSSSWCITARNVLTTKFAPSRVKIAGQSKHSLAQSLSIGCSTPAHHAMSTSSQLNVVTAHRKWSIVGWACTCVGTPVVGCILSCG